MIINANRALPAWALSAVFALLLGAPAGVHASEGNAVPAPRPIAPIVASVGASSPVAAANALSGGFAAPADAAADAAAPATLASFVTVAALQATPSQATASQAAAPHARTRAPSVAAPAPIAAGPVWTDSSGDWRQVGHASWYGGSRWQGRPTAAGDRYDERELTAAHASLPIGSRVRVTVADTGRSVVVTISDRPGTRRRIIDLSRAAAAELGIISRGVAQVTITPG